MCSDQVEVMELWLVSVGAWQIENIVTKQKLKKKKKGQILQKREDEKEAKGSYVLVFLMVLFLLSPLDLENTHSLLSWTVWLLPSPGFHKCHLYVPRPHTYVHTYITTAVSMWLLVSCLSIFWGEGLSLRDGMNMYWN